ncbi:hypothetical protein BKA70DRAFT_1578667, partial [Coprinopsis sp. MPI-PUGE-AT-0042]
NIQACPPLSGRFCSSCSSPHQRLISQLYLLGCQCIPLCLALRTCAVTYVEEAGGDGTQWRHPSPGVENWSLISFPGISLHVRLEPTV